MATTTGGTTYVTSTDLVANYPTASLALANRVDVVASGGPVLVKTANYTITVADILAGNKFLYNSGSAGTFTLPTSSLVDGMLIEVAQIGAGTVTVSGGTIVGTTATAIQYQAIQLVYVAASTSWYSITQSTPSGLSVVAPTSIANSGGSASASGGAVTFTGVTSISMNGIFTSSYSNYRIMVEFTSSGTSTLGGRLRVGGVDDTTAGNYVTQKISGSGATLTGSRSTSATYWWMGEYNTTYRNAVACDIYSPQMTQPTNFLSYNQYSASAAAVQLDGGTHSPSTAYDGFTLVPAAGTITGIFRCYGYKD